MVKRRRGRFAVRQFTLYWLRAASGSRSPKRSFCSMGGRRGGNMVRHLASCMTVLATLLALPAGAADLKVISAGAVRGLLAQIIEDYSLKTGPQFGFKIGRGHVCTPLPP